jgi:tetratricopeptide (TPR) repeat protein
METWLVVAACVVCALIFLRGLIPKFFCSRGDAIRDRGDLQGAEGWYLLAARFEDWIKRLTGRERGVAIVKSSLGFLYHSQRRPVESADAFKEAIRIYTKLGLTQQTAPLYSSLGKLYFDFNELDLAEEALQQALAIYSRRPSSGEETKRVGILLDLISEKRTNCHEASTYVNGEHRFSFLIPAGWIKQRLAEQFVATGGRVAISHKTHCATFNVSVGPPDRPEDVFLPRRAAAARAFIAGSKERVGEVLTGLDVPVGNEPNSASAESEMKTAVRGVERRRRYGIISVIHHNLEYVLQWSAEPDYIPVVKQIIASFRFDS